MKTTGDYAVPARRLAALLMAACLAVPALAADAEEGLRVTESRFYARDGRAQTTPDRISTDSRNDELRPDKATRGSSQQKGTVTASSAPNSEFWFYTADVELFADEDRDGYYHGIDLYFDADTVYTHAEVYAVVYLSLEGGPWIEYAETEDFSIFGATSDDDYMIVTELLSGYPTGSYDLLIELFDAWDNSFVADFGPGNTSELSYLPLEDADRDAPIAAGDTVVVSRGGGGANGPATLAALALLALAVTALRRRRPRPAPLRRRGPRE